MRAFEKQLKIPGAVLELLAREETFIVRQGLLIAPHDRNPRQRRLRTEGAGEQRTDRDILIRKTIAYDDPVVRLPEHYGSAQPMHKTQSTDQFRREAIELSWMANAYLQCAEKLCEQLIEDDWARSPHHCCVALHLAFLGLELWYKAGLAAARMTYPKRHDLASLSELYVKAVPDLPLSIPTHFEKLIPKSHDLFKDDPAPDLQHHFQRFRYATDSKGREFPELDLPDVALLLQEISVLRGTTLEVQLRIWKKYGWS